MRSDERYDAPPFDAAVFVGARRVAHTVRTYPAKATIFAQGDTGNAVFYLQRGQIKLGRQSADGKGAVIAMVGAGHLFGESCLGGDVVRMATATAITHSSVVRVEKDVMLRALRDEPNVSQMFVAHLLARNIRIEEDLADQMFNSSEKRLARALLLLANFEHAEVVTLKISQETLGEMIGTTRSRVSFFMNKFRRLGLVDYKDGIRVNSSLLNVILHD